MEEIFADIKTEDIEVGGFHFKAPFRYFDYSLISAAFPAPVESVKRVLPSKKLRLVEAAPRITTVSLVATENRAIDGMNPYNEFDVMVPVTYETGDNEQELPGVYCIYLPVTTKEALVGGVEIYGYPKFLANISFKHVGEIRLCRVCAAGKEIITLEVGKSATKLESYDIYTYTVKDGQLLRTLLQVQGQNSTHHVRGGASFTLGDHPVAEEIKALGIESTSVMHRYAPQLKMLLHLPGKRLKL
jgi:acetoacetate decarboxylase